jgi:hypothetical protein
LAAELGRSESAVYKAIHRIRRTLRECVERAIARESRASTAEANRSPAPADARRQDAPSDEKTDQPPTGSQRLRPDSPLPPREEELP